MAAVFASDSSSLIVADKNGDVYCSWKNVDVSKNDDELYVKKDPNIDDECGPIPILGHLSMLLDMQISSDGRLLITCDRDEKIRVSCFPNCYNIHTFCLGHREFVSRIKLLSNQPDQLLSASGDFTVKEWNHLSGECLHTLDLCADAARLPALCRTHFSHSDHASPSTFVNGLDAFSVNGDTVVVLTFYQLPLVSFYKLERSSGFSFVAALETARPPVDLASLGARRVLAYLEAAEDLGGSPLVVFEVSCDLTKVEAIDDHPAVRFGRSYRRQLKGCLDESLSCSSLFKHRFDNVSEYKRKKEERLQAPTRKKKAAQ